MHKTTGEGWNQYSPFILVLSTLLCVTTETCNSSLKVDVLNAQSHRIRITNLYGSQTSPIVLCMQYSMISTRNTSLFGFQPSSVVLCIQNSDRTTTIAHVFGSQTSPVAFCIQNNVPSFRNTSLYGSQPLSVGCACKTASLASELLVSMGPSPHLWFLHSKPRLLDQTNKSLRVPDLTCHFVHAKQRD